MKIMIRANRPTLQNWIVTRSIIFWNIQSILCIPLYWPQSLNHLRHNHKILPFMIYLVWNEVISIGDTLKEERDHNVWFTTTSFLSSGLEAYILCPCGKLFEGMEKSKGLVHVQTDHLKMLGLSKSDIIRQGVSSEIGSLGCGKGLTGSGLTVRGPASGCCKRLLQ